MKLNLILICLLILASCSSRKLKKKYEVTDASSLEIPEWVADFDEWKEDEANKDTRYFFYESSPKNDRQMACRIAKARAKSAVAGEVSTNIKEIFAESVDGDTQSAEGLARYVSNTLTSDVEANLQGVKVEKTYWEERSFKKDLGSKTDYDAFTCTTLITVPKKQLEKMLDKVEQKMARQDKGKNSAKELVEKAKAKL